MRGAKMLFHPGIPSGNLFFEEAVFLPGKRAFADPKTNIFAANEAQNRRMMCGEYCACVERPERFYSMSAQIEAERKQYYSTLERSQRGTLDITPWLEWYLGCLGRAVDGAVDSLAHILKKAKIWERINEAPVNERQRAVINRLLDGFEGKLSTSKYAKLAKCSGDTALRDIKLLLDRGILVQEESGGRSTSYRLVDPNSSSG